MLVERIFIDNPLRNFHYLVACPTTGEAVAIDPVEVDAVLDVATRRGFQVRAIVVTHDHWDHAGGRDAMRAATGARVLAHVDSPLEGLDGRLRAGDVVRVGTVALTALDTPGHTQSHVCLLGGGHLFSGDTVFCAGCGNCRHGGHPASLWTTFSEQIWALPDETVLQPGHDYAVNNLRFSLDREPGNPAAMRALAEAEALAAEGRSLVTTIGAERMFNPFFRPGHAAVREGLGLGPSTSDRDVFLALRARRDHW